MNPLNQCTCTQQDLQKVGIPARKRLALCRDIPKIIKFRGCVKTLAQPLLYFTVLLYFLLAMLLFPHAFGNKLLYSNYIGL